MEAQIQDELKTFVAGDFETTGLKPWKGDRVVEFAFLRFRNGEVVDKIASLVHPQRPIPPGIALQFHGITDAMVADAPKFSTLYPKIKKFIGGDPLVYHNADFDLPFLATEAKLSGGTWDGHHRTYCSLENALESGLFKGSHKLEHLAPQIGLTGLALHRAEADAFVACQ